MREHTLHLDGELVIAHLERAASMLTRMRGLLGRAELPANRGLWITPCPSIHMFFMRFAIDVVFLDRDLKVVRVFDTVRPWGTARGGRGAKSALELPPGTAARCGIVPGAQCVIEPC